MSSYINGIYFELNNLEDVFDEIKNIKKDLLELSINKFMNSASEYYYSDLFEILKNNREFETLSLTIETSKKYVQSAEKNKTLFELLERKINEIRVERNENEDLKLWLNKFEISLFIQKKYTKEPRYIAHISGNEDFFSKLLKNPCVKDYSYHDSSDSQLEEMSYKEWKQREKVWNSLIPNNNVKIDRDMGKEIVNKEVILSEILKRDIKAYILEKKEECIYNNLIRILSNDIYSGYLNKKYGNQANNPSNLKLSDLFKSDKAAEHIFNQKYYPEKTDKEINIPQDFLELAKEKFEDNKYFFEESKSFDIEKLFDKSISELRKEHIRLEKIKVQKSLKEAHNFCRQKKL